VLYVDHASGMGGAEHSLLALLSALDRSRYRPVLAAPPGPLADAASAAGIDVRRLGLPRLQRQLTGPIRLVRGVAALRRVAAAERSALIHGNVLRATLYAAPAAGALGCPLVWHVRDLHRRGPAVRWLCWRARAVVAISRAVAEALPCADAATVVYNPVVVPAARPCSRAELGLPADGPLVAMVASLRRWKGHEAFLELAARTGGPPQPRFLVIGGSIFDDDEPGYAEALQARAAELGVADRVAFLGQRDDLADLWPHLAVVVHPALAEPFGRVVAEAQLAGLPVVAYASGGLPELIDDGQTGRLVAPGDVGALASAVGQLLADPERRSQLARAGQLSAARRFAPASHARAIEGLYDRLLAPGAGRRSPGARR
jgi:glycosyltransferase involved in cell wall biosynthesis